jgi:hypothetical protein
MGSEAVNKVLSACWSAEVTLMKMHFPQFARDVQDGVIGFAGRLEGRSGRSYDVRITSRASIYPLQPPKVFIQPTEGLLYRYLDGSVSIDIQWRPGTSSFALIVLYAAEYLQQRG